MRGNSAFKNVHGSLSYSAFNQVITIDGHWVHPDTAQTHTHTFHWLIGCAVSKSMLLHNTDIETAELKVRQTQAD